MWRTLFIFAAFGCSQAITDEAAEDAERRKPRVDAATTTDEPPPPPGDPAAAGIVSCYSSGAPANTCATPAYCCFNNYSASHDGYCTTTETCSFGTILCDGPEDCASGQQCCATAMRDPYFGTTGYQLACRSGSCGGPPFDRELCHPNAN